MAAQQLIFSYERKVLTSAGAGIYNAVLQYKHPRSMPRGKCGFKAVWAAEGVAMLHKRALLVAVVFSLAFSVCPLLYGQATGSFFRHCLRQSGRRIAGATVKATSQGTGLSREARTDDSGHYLIPLLP